MTCVKHGVGCIMLWGCFAVFCSTESTWNNEDGGLPRNSSGESKTVSQQIGSWVQLGVPTGLWSQTRINIGNRMVKSGFN